MKINVGFLLLISEITTEVLDIVVEKHPEIIAKAIIQVIKKNPELIEGLKQCLDTTRRSRD